MDILFIHQNFSGQFKSLAPALVQSGHRVRALTINGAGAPGVETIRYSPRRGTTPNIHAWASDFETKIIRGEACAAEASRLKAEGYRPDVIVGHPGWGEMLFLRDIWPTTPQLHFLEFYYASNSDVGFDPEFADPNWRSQARVRAKNASGLLNLEQMDAAYSPTNWQRSSYPAFAQSRINVIHDGIDTDMMVPKSGLSLTLSSGRELRSGMKLVTFVNRNLEPYRGYHVFMRALANMQRMVPDAFFVVVGGDGVSYGAKAPDGQSWKHIFLDEVRERVDLARVAFVGSIPYDVFQCLMQMSAAHVYLTYPFVLSWSMLEAMACGAPVIGSATPPVQEVIEHGRNGLLVDFFDRQGLAETVANVLNNPHQYVDMRLQARQTILDKYDLNRVCLPRQMDLIQRVANGSTI